MDSDTPGRIHAEYADFLASFDDKVPNGGWQHEQQIRRLTHAELAICLRANPDEHADALADIGITADAIAEALEGDAAFNPYELIGTAYRVLLTKYLRTRLLTDLEYRAEDNEAAQRFERPDVDAENDAAAVTP